MHNILVTGASGFIGRWLSPALTQQGHNVFALLRQPERITELRQQCAARGGVAEHLQALAGDLTLPRLGTQSTPALSHIYHLGAQFAWGLSPAQARACNVNGALAAVELAAEHGAWLILVGGFMTENTAYLAELGINRQHPEQTDWARVYRATGAYEASKLEGYFRAQALANAKGVAFTGVNPATVCGHSQHGSLDAQQPLAQLIDNLAQGRLRGIPGNTAHWLPLVSVDALAQLLAHLSRLRPAQVPPTLLALDPTSPNLATLLGWLADDLQVPAPRHFVPLPLLRALLRIKPLARALATDPEGLAFIRPERLTDASDSTTAFMQQHSLSWPPLRLCVERSAQHYMQRSTGRSLSSASPC